MDHDTFHHLIKARLTACEEVLTTKNSSYSTSDDALHNFHRAAQLQNCTPERALLGMWTKHLVSVIDIIDNLPTTPDEATLSEKITDSINYLLFLEALIRDTKSKSSVICHE